MKIELNIPNLDALEETLGYLSNIEDLLLKAHRVDDWRPELITFGEIKKALEDELVNMKEK